MTRRRERLLPHNGRAHVRPRHARTHNARPRSERAHARARVKFRTSSTGFIEDPNPGFGPTIDILTPQNVGSALVAQNPDP